MLCFKMICFNAEECRWTGLGLENRETHARLTLFAISASHCLSGLFFSLQAFSVCSHGCLTNYDHPE